MPRSDIPASPTVRLRRLSDELLRLRIQSGLTVREAASRSGWSASKISRTENRVGGKPVAAEVGRLLDVYGVTEQDQPQLRRALLALAREASRQGWWVDYAAISDEQATYIGMEAGAASLRSYCLSTIHPLLQTPDYTRALITARAGHLSQDEREELLEVLDARQQRLHDSPPLRLWAILGEESLLRSVGGPKVMAAQLEQIAELAELDHVTVQIHPFSAGSAPVRGPFSIITFPEVLDPEAVHIPSAAPDVWVEGEGTARYLEAFEQLVASSLSAPASTSHFTGLARQL